MVDKELVKNIAKILPDSNEEEIYKFLSFYSLQERESLMELPDGYYHYDVYPWRYNRGLSLIRKPLVRVLNRSTETNIYYWGPRQTTMAGLQILNLYYTGKLRVTRGGKLDKLIGRILNSKGRHFTKEVFEFLDEVLNQAIIDKEVPINPNSTLKSENDLGDIDILIIDEARQSIYSIECKNTEVGKNIKQIVEEVDRLFGSDSKKGWIEKHLARQEWLKCNKAVLGQKYDIELSKYNLVSALVTSEGLISKHLKRKEQPFKLISFYELKDKLLDVFETS